MKSIWSTIIFLAFAVIALSSCTTGPQNEDNSDWPYNGVPVGSTLMDGRYDAMLFLEKDTSSNQERLWIYDINTKKATLFLTCHRHYGPKSCSGQNGMKWSKDSINNICKAQFVDWDNHLIMVGERATTYMNVYIVSDSDALYLTGANRFLGQLYNNGWYVTEYRTYGTDDTYSILYYYDYEGNLVRTDSCETSNH